MHAIGIEFISVFALPPDQFVHLAADLGCKHIGLALTPFTPNPHGYPAWSLREDAGLRRATKAALVERGVSISLAEGFLIRPGADIRALAPDMEMMRDLGATRANTISVEMDAARTLDQYAAFAELARAAGMNEATLEFGPIFATPDLPAALAALKHVNQPSFRLLLDTMHWVRAGCSAKEIAELDADLIGYVQVCDGKRAFTPESYGHEALRERQVPGAGEYPLRAILAALKRDYVLGLEVPMLGDAEAGIGPKERMQRCIEATRALLP